MYICIMIIRSMQPLVQAMAGKMPILSLMGPRQSGKTTLARSCFPAYRYLNVESPEVQQMIAADPRGALRTSDVGGVILDEVQRMPELLSWVQVMSDESGKPGEYILTGSQNLLVRKGVSQTLAGRVFISELLPLSMAELLAAGRSPVEPDDFILSGGYPRLFDAGIDPGLFYPSYIQTYMERDVAGLVMPQNLVAFRRFIGLLAGRIGQLVNFSSLAVETGVDIKTIQAWCSLLQSAYLIHFLQPFHSSHSKRLVKTPKVYFHDTGVACSVLGIRSVKDLKDHWARGALFENMVISEWMKHFLNAGRPPAFYFWRDHRGTEVDLLVETAGGMQAIEVKSGSTFQSSFTSGLKHIARHGMRVERSSVVYGGSERLESGDIQIMPWNACISG